LLDWEWDVDKVKADVPPYHALLNPTLKALRALGGSATVEELDNKVPEFIAIPQAALEILHNPETSTKTAFEYRMAWARTYLKNYGLIDNSRRAVWTLTSKAESLEKVDEAEVVKFVRAQVNLRKAKQESLQPEKTPSPGDDLPVETDPWRSILFQILTRELEPAAFERLTQRLLRESGFTQVEVTGRTGDGGIDGRGIAKIHGIMSFHVVFQCKRYQGVVGAPDIRAFRGAMVGRSDKGLFITTGSFTRDAIKEATRDGAPPIDLMDGEGLANNLKELLLGIKVEMIERVTVDPQWFKAI
jgi:restriction system protein